MRNIFKSFCTLACMPGKLLAFDIGGTSIRLAVVVDNKVKKIVRRNTPKTKKAFLAEIDSLISELLTDDVLGIGVACAGVIRGGVVKESPNLPISNFDLGNYIRRRSKKEVRVCNDAVCFSLAELLLGCRKRNFFLITLGTGIGGGVVVNGAVYLGSRGFAGELGHIYVDGYDFEYLWKSSRWRLEMLYGKGFLIKDLVKKKDKKSRAVLDEIADFLGKGIASLVSVLDPDIVVLAGGPREAGSAFSKRIEKSVNHYSFLPGKVKVSFTKLGEAGVLGASLLFYE